MPKALEAQRDFSAGELDISAKRSDQSGEVAPVLKAGVRQAANFRILNSKALRNRSGRRALFLDTGRVDEVLMSPGNTFFLAFDSGTLRVLNSSGVQVFAQGGFGWGAGTEKNVVWDIYGLSIYICIAGAQPQVLTWDGVATWSVGPYTPDVISGGQKRTLFYRLSPHGVTMQPSAQSGAITMAFSPAVASFSAGLVGTLMRFCGREIQITGFTSTSALSGTVLESLPIAQTIAVTSGPAGFLNVGDEVVGLVSNAKGIVTSIGSGTMNVQLLQTALGTTGDIITIGFNLSELIVGPGGAVTVATAGGSITDIAPQAVVVWDEEVMNAFRGWPAACFIDQNRLGFCNFPAVPSGIAWSAIALPTDLYVGAQPENAIFELAPGKSQVQFVAAGMESSEFAFCDNAIYYIPISVTNPLKPGSVAFNQLSSQGSMPNVRPRSADQTIIYMKAGGTQVGAVQVPGAYFRPYVVDNISELHSHLFTKSPAISIAIPPAATQFEEFYIYILMANGTMAVGKYTMHNGVLETGADSKPKVGWTPFGGAGAVGWVSAQGGDVIFATTYSPNGAAPVSVIEILDDTQYLDAALLVNNLPAPFTPPGGNGPLYLFPGPNSSVTLMDNSTRDMGVYLVDGNGNIIPQNHDSEDLASPTLVAGQAWTATVEPFIPAAPPGPDQHQRRTRRRISSFGAHVRQSTGFYFAKIASRIGPLLPAVGTVTLIRRVPAWNQDEDPTQPPPLRETSHNTRPSGRDFDPRVALIKDNPGPLEVLEITVEAST